MIQRFKTQEFFSCHRHPHGAGLREVRRGVLQNTQPKSRQG